MFNMFSIDEVLPFSGHRFLLICLITQTITVLYVSIISRDLHITALRQAKDWERRNGPSSSVPAKGVGKTGPRQADGIEEEQAIKQQTASNNHKKTTRNKQGFEVTRLMSLLDKPLWCLCFRCFTSKSEPTDACALLTKTFTSTYVTVQSWQCYSSAHVRWSSWLLYAHHFLACALRNRGDVSFSQGATEQLAGYESQWPDDRWISRPEQRGWRRETWWAAEWRFFVIYASLLDASS